MKKLVFENLINMDGKKVFVQPYQENQFVKVGELNEMTVKTEDGKMGI